MRPSLWLSTWIVAAKALSNITGQCYSGYKWKCFLCKNLDCLPTDSAFICLYLFIEIRKTARELCQRSYLAQCLPKCKTIPLSSRIWNSYQGQMKSSNQEDSVSFREWPTSEQPLNSSCHRRNPSHQKCMPYLIRLSILIKKTIIKDNIKKKTSFWLNMQSAAFRMLKPGRLCCT